MKYYSCDKLVSKPAQYYIIMGQRGPGKTYTCLERALTKYKNYGYRFLVIRRIQDATKASNVKKMMDNMQKVVTKLYGDMWRLYVYSGDVYLYEDIPDEKIHRKDMELIGSFVSLSDSENIRGNKYLNYKTTINDEFMPESGYALEKEFTAYMSIINTVVRDSTDVENFITGNTIDPNNIIFKSFGIDARKMKPGNIYNCRCMYKGKPGMLVRVEYTKPLVDDAGKQFVSPYMQYDGKYSTMAVEGGWLIDSAPDTFNGKTIEELLKTKDYVNGGTIHFIDYGLYVTFPNKINNPLLITKFPVASQVTNMSNIKQLGIFPYLYKNFKFKLWGNCIFGETFDIDKFKQCVYNDGISV